MTKKIFGRKKFLIKLAAIILAIIVLFIPVRFYLKKVVIYEPVTIEMKGIGSDELQQIYIYGITPFDRVDIFPVSDSINGWQNNYSFLKTVQLVIPDTLRNKITQINVSIGSKKSILSIGDLKSRDKSETKSRYLLPRSIRSEDNLIKKILSVFHWVVIHNLMKVILPLFMVLFVLLIPIKKKKDTASRHSILIILKEKLGPKNAALKRIKTWLKIIFFSLFIAFVLFFGFLLLAYTISTYITTLLFIVLTCLLIYYSLKYVFNKIKVRESNMKRFRTAMYIFLIVWLCFETFFKLENTNLSYNETINLFYASGFNKKPCVDKNNPDLLLNPPCKRYIDSRKEFAFEIITNKEGLRDIDHPVQKGKGEYRIICIGNSFTEGIGSPQDSTWPKLLEDKLRISLKNKITVLNAGKAGSDFFFGYTLLEKRMLKYQPDIVLLALTSSEFDFYRFRGGFERFTSDGYQFRKGPWWEKVYAVSYICRFITDDLMHYKYFLTPEEYKNDSIKALTDITACIHRFYGLSLKHHFKFALVNCDEGLYKLNPVVDFLKQENIIPVIDLVEYDRNIEKLSNKNRKAYYWPLDGHCNSRGYAMFARGVEWNLRKMGILDSLNKK